MQLYHSFLYQYSGAWQSNILELHNIQMPAQPPKQPTKPEKIDEIHRPNQTQRNAVQVYSSS
jgi:hypothetical protein